MNFMDISEKTLVIIDGDGLVYHASKQDLKQSLDILDEKVQNIFDSTKASHYLMLISLGTYFRNNLSPEYKANRKKYESPLLWTRTLKNFLIESYGAVAGRNVEADDMCAYIYNKPLYCGKPKSDNEICLDMEIFSFDPQTLTDYTEVKKILCSPDKDLLNNIPGKHFNYSYKLPDKNNPDSVIKGFWIETSEDEAKINFWKSMITGDPSDNIPGLPGKGKAYAEHLYKDIAVWDMPTLCTEAYQSYYKNEAKAIFEFQKNYRLLHMLNSDEDFYREVGYIPELPMPVKIESQIEEIKLNQVEF